MKNITPLLLVFILTACSSGNKETAGQDSVAAANDTIVDESTETSITEADADEVEETEEEMSDTSQLEITFDETAGLVFERQEMYYTVSITTSQYEASSEVTWYFDTDISPIYFKESWASEGNEGYTEFFIKDGDVACASEEDSNETKKWCRTTGGIVITLDGGSGDPLSDLIPSVYGAECNVELARYLDILKSILNQADKTEEEDDEDSYTFKIENVTSIGGQDVTESTTVRIPKKVYEMIIRY